MNTRFSRTIPVLLGCWIWALVCASPATADELVLNDAKLLNYADFLYQKGEYYRAISEYKRLQFFFPDSRYHDRSVLQIGRSYLAGKDFQEAINHWQLQIDAPGNLKSPALDQARVLLGITLLDKDLDKPYRLRVKRIEEALTQFQSLGSDLDRLPAEYQAIPAFVRDWKNRPEIDAQSPWIAGGLSAVLPGAGSAYNGRYLEGAYALFFTGLFLAATLDAVNNDQSELSVLFGFFTISFYGGSIYTAVNGAHKLNDRMRHEQLIWVRKKHGIWFIPATETGNARF